MANLVGRLAGRERARERETVESSDREDAKLDVERRSLDLPPPKQTNRPGESHRIKQMDLIINGNLVRSTQEQGYGLARCLLHIKPTYCALAFCKIMPKPIPLLP